jgi:hypothetical protein
MKVLLRVLGAVVVCVVLALLVLRVTGLDPHERIPGLWLTGTVAAAPSTDWSFTDKIVTVKVQTSTQYLLPHSVTTWCIAYNGQLYLATSGAAVREWPRDVARDPHVRLKVGDQLFDATLMVVNDQGEREGVLKTRAKKYNQKYPPVGQTFTVYHVIPG